MKIAVIGGGPLGLECALHFHQMGGGVTLFTQESPTSISHTDQSRSIRELLKSKITWKKNHVTQVHKRFYKKDESIQGVSRFSDLFRVVYDVTPSNAQTSDQLKEKMSPELLQSLEAKMEFFEDFDVVIDATGLKQKSKPMGEDFELVGEKKLKSAEGIHYGMQALNFSKASSAFSEIALLGSTELSGLCLLALKDWFKENEDHRVFLIDHHEAPLNKIKESLKAHHEFRECLDEIDRRLEARIVQFEKKLHEWNELEDYVKAKIPRPLDPIPQIVIFSGHQVTAVDRLIDKNRFFLTSEVVPFRSSLEQKENSAIPLKTIGVDHILVTTGFEPVSLNLSNLKINGTNTVQEETGFYFLKDDSLTQGLKKIAEIETDLLKRFSRK